MSAPIPPAVILSAPHGPPFRAIVETTFDQRLSDGNSIHGTVRYHIARDSSGKTLLETPFGCYIGDDGHRHQQIQVTVTDPSGQTTTRWQTNNTALNIATISHITHSDPPEEVKAEVKAAAAANADRIRREVEVVQSQTRRESLGSSAFQGVSATGTRTVRTIPAGDEGNTQPIEIINETWTSGDLGITMKAMSDDPRRGGTTTEVEEIHLGEPDPATFSPPPGYTIKELTIKELRPAATAALVAAP
ncbi:hypothetical protein [Edaphobacter bradus]|uniref:hypothetical protein n=1 Tax=Edaphobacter bradus TaxID=2259016 RepID=UPI0021E04258|nr:hypothetical protein [Edaphobacter bradus]